MKVLLLLSLFSFAQDCIKEVLLSDFAHNHNIRDLVQIGRGSNGAIYKVNDQLVMKKQCSSFDKSGKMAKRYYRILDLIVVCKEENISNKITCPVFSEIVPKTNDRNQKILCLYTFFEKMDGSFTDQEIYFSLANETYTESERIDILSQLKDLDQTLKDKGLIHGDISNNNILYNRVYKDGSVKIDLKVADVDDLRERNKNPLTMALSIGTPGFHPSEIFEESRRMGGRAKISKSLANSEQAEYIRDRIAFISLYLRVLGLKVRPQHLNVKDVLGNQEIWRYQLEGHFGKDTPLIKEFEQIIPTLMTYLEVHSNLLSLKRD